MATVVRMPKVLAGESEAALQAWLVSVGEEVAIGQPLAEIETEKAVVEYEAEEAGVLAERLVAPGDSVPVGAPIAVLAAVGESIAAALAAVEAVIGSTSSAIASAQESRGTAAEVPGSPRTSGPTRIEPLAPRPGSRPERLLASPLVRKLDREQGLDLSAVRGSGPGGRIVRRDLETRSPAAAVAVQPVTASGETGYVDRPHTPMRRAIARRLTESTTAVPQFTVTADCRVDALIDLRRVINARSSPQVSLNDLVVKAVGAALMAVPEANAIWTPDATRVFSTADVGVAVAVEGGLLTPVVRGVDALSIAQLARTLGELTERARAGRLQQRELEGGAFTVSNLGMFGARAFTAIINPPQSGILAVGAAGPRVIAHDGDISVATVMTVTLTADHRVLDGAIAARWLAAFVDLIENPVTILV